MNSNPPKYQYIETADPSHVHRERSKAREIRGSNWWRQQLGKGVCYHCGGKFPKENLTMDHVLALSRGGRSTKKNIVVSCKECNSHKKNLTVAELRFKAIND